jgi:hypothetical protein
VDSEIATLMPMAQSLLRLGRWVLRLWRSAADSASKLVEHKKADGRRQVAVFSVFIDPDRDIVGTASSDLRLQEVRPDQQIWIKRSQSRLERDIANRRNAGPLTDWNKHEAAQADRAGCVPRPFAA